MKPCKDSGEQITITTYGDSAKGFHRMVCGDCGAQYTEPTAEAEDAQRRAAETLFAEHPDLRGAR